MKKDRQKKRASQSHTVITSRGFLHTFVRVFVCLCVFCACTCVCVCLCACVHVHDRLATNPDAGASTKVQVLTQLLAARAKRHRHLDVESIVQELELLTIEAYRGAWALVY